MNSKFKTVMKKNSSTILTGIGVACLGGVIYSAITDTLKYREKLDNLTEDISTKDKIILTTASYTRTMLFSAATLACMMGANIINKKHQTSLTASYMALQASYNEFKKKTEEIYGKDAVADIVEQIVKDKYTKHERSDDDVMLFYDVYGGIYIESTMEDILRAEYEINRLYAKNQFVDVNEFYKLLGLNHGIKYGDEYGWSIYNPNEEVWIEFEHRMTIMEDGLECCLIIMKNEPVHCFTLHH